ncbi:MAG: strictosidine synthase family protein [Deltaproteobacteria bacterium]|nr:strictosidine synthase family protein [Deltaproteobacteria bacterium]
MKNQLLGFWRRHSLLCVLTGCLAPAALYLLLWPVQISPQKWIPLRAPALTGVYEQNHALTNISRIGQKYLPGSEDIAFDSHSSAWFGLKDGSIWRWSLNDNRPQMMLTLKGPIFGMAFDSENNLYIAAPKMGLMRIAPTLETKLLSAKEGGIRFGIVNDVDVAADGSVYFTDSSCKFGHERIYNEIMEAGPNGRLLKYDEQTNQTTLLQDGLHFANGVALGPNDAYLLVSEMTRYRIRRYWLKGPKKDYSDIFKENLPGMPDGVSFNKKDTFWVALYTTRSPALDSLLYPHPIFREMLFRIPSMFRPKSKPYGFVLGLAEDGTVTYNYQDPTGAFSPVSSVVEHQRYLYLGSTVQHGVGLFPIEPDY